MIINFFDRFFKPLTDNNSLAVEKYDLVKCAVDHDIFKAVCEPHDISINPFFVTMEDERGRYVYGALAGIPTVDKYDKTNINANDLKTLFVGEVVADFTDYPSSGKISLHKHLERLFRYFAEQLIQGYYSVSLNLKDESGELTDAQIDVRIIRRDEAYVVNLWDLVYEILLYTDCFMDSKIDLVNKKIVYRIRDNGKEETHKAILLSDYGLKDFQKLVAPVNEVVAVDDDLNNPRWWFLTSNNEVTQNVALRDIFPIKRKIFKNEDVLVAEAQSILALAENKYNENISIPFNQAIDPREFYFDTFLDVYPKAQYDAEGNRTNLYKSLPIGAIGVTEDRGANTYWLEIGYRPSRGEQLLRKLLAGGK